LSEPKSEAAFYVGRRSFHMQVKKLDKKAAPSPPALSPPPATPPPLTARASLPTPTPTPSPARAPQRTPTAVRRPSVPALERGLTMSRSTFAGFCLTAFACGIVTTVAVDRLRFRASDDIASRTDPPRGPSVAAAAPRAPTQPAEPRVVPEIRVLPAAEPAPAAPSGEPAVAPTPAHAEAPVRRQLVRDVTPPIQPARKRRAATPSSAEGPADPPPTERWTDPFE